MELLGGVASGIALGFMMWPLKKAHNLIKTIVIVGIVFAFIIISEEFNFAEIKWIGILAYGYVTFRMWGKA